MNQKVSAIVPLYNEEENLPLLHSRLREGLEMLNQRYEIVYINDGSTDKSYNKLKAFFTKDPNNLVVINLRKNEGKPTAQDIGIQNSSGEIIVTIDSDLQHDPREIPKLINAINNGYDMVTGVRIDRGDAKGRILFSKLVNYVLTILTGYKSKDFYCGFKAYRREVIEELNITKDLFRFIAYIADRRGFKTGDIPITYYPRKYGNSKYGLGLFKRAFYDLLMIVFVLRAQYNPLYFFGTLALFTFFILIAYNILEFFIGEVPYTIISVIINIMLLLFSILFLLTGTILDAILRFEMTKNTIKGYAVDKILSD